MSKQAKTLTPQELRRVLDYIATRKHAARNRALITITHFAGLRVSEAAKLLYGDVIGSDGKVRGEIKLRAEQTKGNEARTVFISEKLRKELATYVKTLGQYDPEHALFFTQQKRGVGFSPNTLAQFFHYVYKRAGIEGASSHSGRRFFITQMSSKGVSARAIMALSGHKNLSTTQKYIDVNDNMLRKAVELV